MAEPEFWQDLVARGVVQQTTRPDLGAWLAGEVGKGQPFHCYCGFDPTADSLHVGSLMPVLGLRRLKSAGITPIVLVGGATGMIGDPSGKSAERTLLDAERLAHNVAGMTAQLETLLEGDAGKDFLMVNNADWFASIRFVDFLRDVGKHFSVNMMIHKESVRARLEDREHGISYTEFSYMLLQAYDYLHLFEKHGCRLQVGGSDQWGNITGGIDLIHHKHHGEEVHGCTFPLITTSSGQKFGKSERGAIWIDRRRTGPYFFYKYFFHADDADVGRFLRYFTFLPLEEIADLERQVKEEPHLRAGQKALAREVTALVHGRDTASACESLEHAMHVDDADAFEKAAGPLGLLEPPAEQAAESDPANQVVTHRALEGLGAEGISVIDLAIELGLFKSKGDAKREIQSANSGFFVAGEQVKNLDFRVTREWLASRKVIQIRKGKKNKRMVCFH